MKDIYMQKTKLASRSVGYTIAILALLASIGFFLVSKRDIAIGCVLWSCLVAWTLCALFFLPRRLELCNGALTIVFPLRRKRIGLSQIEQAKPYGVTMNFVRTFGSGGYLGWWGWFRNQELGRFIVYASDLDHVMLVTMRTGKRYVISCADPEAMSQAIAQAK